MKYVYPGLITFILEQVDDEVYFQILEQNTQLLKPGVGPIFLASNGLTIGSWGFPEIMARDVCLQGNFETRNNNRHCYRLPGEADASCCVLNVLQAFSELGLKYDIKLESELRQPQQVQLSLWD